MKEGTIIKLRESILYSSDTTGRLMKITKATNHECEAIPVGDGWDFMDFRVPHYIVLPTMIDHTYKHKEDES